MNVLMYQQKLEITVINTYIVPQSLHLWGITDKCIHTNTATTRGIANGFISKYNSKSPDKKAVKALVTPHVGQRICNNL